MAQVPCELREFFFIIVPTYISILEGGEKAVWPWVTICVRLALYSLVLGEKKKRADPESSNCQAPAQLGPGCFSQISQSQEHDLPTLPVWSPQWTSPAFLFPRQASLGPLPFSILCSHCPRPIQGLCWHQIYFQRRPASALRCKVAVTQVLTQRLLFPGDLDGVSPQHLSSWDPDSPTQGCLHSYTDLSNPFLHSQGSRDGIS